MNDQVDGLRTAPRGHGVYVRVLDALPPNGAAALKSAATTRRQIRRRVRLYRRRLGRRATRQLRRVRSRSAPLVRRCIRWWQRWYLRALRPTISRVGGAPGSTGRLGLHESPAPISEPTQGLASSAPIESRWGTRLRRILLPPTLTLPGEGPTVAVDARGITSDEVVRRVHRFDRRTVFIVDDPNIVELRATGAHYEYAPTTPEIPGATRLQWIIDAYGVDRTVMLGPDISSESVTPENPGRLGGDSGP